MPENSNAAAIANDAAAASAAATTTGSQSTPVKVGGKEYGSWDEVGKAYESAQAELGKWTQQYGDLKKQHEQVTEAAKKWDEWWNTVRPLWGQDVEDFLRRKLSGEQVGAVREAAAVNGSSVQQQQQADPLDGFETLSPREQAQRLQHVMGTQFGYAMNQRMAELAKAFQDTFTQRENYYQTYLNNHLSLMRKAFEEKIRNPNFNIDQTMEMAAKAIGGQVDPSQLGQQLISAQGFQAQLEAAKKAAYEQGKKDFEQEVANKKQEAVPLLSSAPKFKVNTGSGGPHKGLASYKEKAAERIFKDFGPQWLLPG